MGTLIFDGNTYTGELNGNKGIGIITYMNEQLYEGEWIDKKDNIYREGKGVLSILFGYQAIVTLPTSKSNFDLMISDSFLNESVISSSVILTINSMCHFSFFLGELFGLRLRLSHVKLLYS